MVLTVVKNSSDATKVDDNVNCFPTISLYSQRVGGRIQTFRNLDDDWEVELGAARIPASHSLVRELVRQFGLRLEVGIGLNHYQPSNVQNKIQRQLNFNAKEIMVNDCHYCFQAAFTTLFEYNNWIVYGFVQRCFV